MVAETTRFGALLKYFRQAAGLSQEALAERADLSARTISDLERGINQTPRYATFDLLVKALALSSQQSDFLKASLQHETGDQAGENRINRQFEIPLPPTRLIGRESEQTQALNLLRSGQVRLLTLTGPSGVGKTRLALQLAQVLRPDFRDGIVFIPISAVREASLVPNTIAQTLEIRETPSTSIPSQVLVRLQDKQLLLVLDNLEQILDCSPFLADLLAACPRLVILATSRSPLRLRAEHELLLTPLGIEEAAQLFRERAEAVRPGQTYLQDRVASICESLDCLPLAIELAAIQTRLLNLPELENRLAHRFALLRGGARDLPARQQTMEDAIAWSYDLLSAPQQRLFRFLGVFLGGFSLEAAESVAWPDDTGSEHSRGEIHAAIQSEDRLHTLAALVESSLVLTGTDPSGIIRFSLLELIRDYALKRLRIAGESELARQRHAIYYAGLAESAEALFESGPATPNLTLLNELTNVQAALEWAETSHEVALGLRLIGFARLWHSLGQPERAQHWFERMLALDERAREQGWPAAPPALRAKRQYGLGRILLARGETAAARATAVEAITLAEQIGDGDLLTNAWATLGMIAQASGELDEAEKAFHQSTLFASQAGDPRMKYRAFVWQAELARTSGRLDEAGRLLEQALAAAAASNSGWDNAIITTLSGHLASQRKDFRLARARYRESLPQLQAFRSPTYIAWCLEGCAAVLSNQPDPKPAARLCAAAVKLRELADAPLPTSEREAFEHTLARLKGALGRQAFQQAWLIGSGYSLDEVVAYALSILE